jgi:hypothetical protein
MGSKKFFPFQMHPKSRIRANWFLSTFNARPGMEGAEYFAKKGMERHVRSAIKD